MLGEERCRISRLELDVSHWHFVQTVGEHDLVARLIIFLHLYSLSHNNFSLFSCFFLNMYLATVGLSYSVWYLVP